MTSRCAANLIASSDRADQATDDAGVISATTDTVVLDGELDISRVADIAAHLDLIITTCDGDVRCDSSAVTFIDAGALGALVEAANRLARANRALWMVNTAPCVRRIVQLTNVGGVLPSR